QSVCTDSDGDVVIGGFFDKYDGVSRTHLARVRGDSGKNDSLFNPGDGANDPVYTVNVYEGGKVFIGGSFDQFDGNKVTSVARLNSDGSHDSSFHLSQKSGIDSWTVYSSHVAQDNKVFVGGNFHVLNDEQSPKGSFIRLDANGSIDSSYSPDELPIDASVFAISAKSEGEAIITGDFPETYVKTTENIARINTKTGQIDDSFRVGVGANGEVKALIKLSDGNLLVGGAFTRINGAARLGLAKLNADGEVLAFSSQVEGGSVYSIVERSDGKIVIGGSFQSVGGNPSLKRIARLNQDGSIDASFDPPGKTTRTWVQTHPWKTWVGEWRVDSTGGFDGTVRSVSLVEDDRILAVGEFNYYGETFQPRLALLDSDAGINENFTASRGYASPSGSIQQALVLKDGRILLVGNFPGKLKCLLKDGSVDSGFVPESINGEISSAVIQKDGRILLGGDFTKVGSREMNGVAVLNRNGSLYNAFDPGAGADGPVTRVLSLRDGGSVVLGSFRRFGSQERVGIVRLMKDGSMFSGYENNDLEITSINSTR
ncbi:MAG: delta-60 repeat domain-containing protein, partial [Verrucomicrobiales bacterium]|nr:delta-60 repeat domain-containing protein [Verrucomicrobiales bacterium]